MVDCYRKKFVCSLQKSLMRQSGLTLLEVCIILVLVSLLLIPIIKMADLERFNKRIQKDHYGTVSDLVDLILDYGRENGAYPLPSGPNLPITNSQVFVPVSGTAIPTNCAISGAAGSSGVICRPEETGFVYIGTVPVTALGLPPEKGLDQYGRKFTYVVMRNLTNQSATFNNTGLMDIFDTNGVGRDGFVQFAVISHGKNGIGGFGANGNLLPASCNWGEAEMFNRFQCKRDIAGVAGRFNKIYDQDSFGIWKQRESFNEGEGNSYYDDSVRYVTSLYGGRLWTPRISGDALFTAGQNLGVGYVDDTDSAPPQRVSVKTGNVRASTTINTPNICSSSGSPCYSPEQINKTMSDSTVYCGDIPMTEVMNTGNLPRSKCVQPAVNANIKNCPTTAYWKVPTTGAEPECAP